MKTDWKAIDVERADAEDVIREVKLQTRRQCDPMREHGFRIVETKVSPDGTERLHIERAVPISRRKVARPGKNISPDEGRALAKAKRETTLLCTIRAAGRGRFHAMTFLKSPELLEEFARTWRSFAVVEPAPTETETIEASAQVAETKVGS